MCFLTDEYEQHEMFKLLEYKVWDLVTFKASGIWEFLSVMRLNLTWYCILCYILLYYGQLFNDYYALPVEKVTRAQLSPSSPTAY